MALHDDIRWSDINLNCGLRALSVKVFLSDVEGGEVVFPSFGRQIAPQKGSAIAYPNVTDKDLQEFDERLTMESFPVTKGTKYDVTVWIIFFDWKIPNRQGWVV